MADRIEDVGATQDVETGAFEDRDFDLDLAHLLVFLPETTLRVGLPEQGSIVLGRGRDVDVELPGQACSRRHARIDMERGSATITDLGSANGTRVNGHKIADPTALRSGDVIDVGPNSIIFHALVARRSRSLLSESDVRQRLDEELERALRYSRPLTVFAVHHDPQTQPASIAQMLSSTLRTTDIFGLGCEAEILVIMPETAREDAFLVASRVQKALEDIKVPLRIGFATFPSDGCDATLLAANARAAAELATEGTVAAAQVDLPTLDVGGQTIVVADPAMTRAYTLIRRLAHSDLPVLIGGETGTGKEIAARSLHYWSPRASKPFVAVNCAAISETLVESELFGHEKGAFSGALNTKPGLFEAAEGGTVFLDEIGDMTLASQAKLLRVLETKRVMRVGSVVERSIDVRFVAATNVSLQSAVKAGRFRQDLLFRLQGGMVWLPSLRDRPSEIPLLTTMLLQEASAARPEGPLTMSEEAMRLLVAHRWPGNLRELKNLIQYLAATVGGSVVRPNHLRERLQPGLLSEATELSDEGDHSHRDEPAFRPIADEIRELEAGRIRSALRATGGNKTQAAKLISMPLRTFVGKLKQYQLE